MALVTLTAITTPAFNQPDRGAVLPTLAGPQSPCPDGIVRQDRSLWTKAPKPFMATGLWLACCAGVGSSMASGVEERGDDTRCDPASTRQRAAPDAGFSRWQGIYRVIHGALSLALKLTLRPALPRILLKIFARWRRRRQTCGPAPAATHVARPPPRQALPVVNSVLNSVASVGGGGYASRHATSDFRRAPDDAGVAPGCRC